MINIQGIVHRIAPPGKEYGCPSYDVSTSPLTCGARYFGVFMSASLAQNGADEFSLSGARFTVLSSVPSMLSRVTQVFAVDYRVNASWSASPNRLAGIASDSAAVEHVGPRNGDSVGPARMRTPICIRACKFVCPFQAVGVLPSSSHTPRLVLCDGCATSAQEGKNSAGTPDAVCLRAKCREAVWVMWIGDNETLSRRYTVKRHCSEGLNIAYEQV